MKLFDFESWFTLLTGFAIFIMGLRVFWLDSGNRMYQAFMLSTFLLFVQNFLFFSLEQTQNIILAYELRTYQETTWNIALFFICITMWLYAKQFIPRTLKPLENNILYFTLSLSLVFILLEACTSFKHGQLILLADYKWAITIQQPQLYDWLRMIWAGLIYTVSIYFSYLPFKYAKNPTSQWLRGFVFVIYSVIVIGSFIQNYYLTIFFGLPCLLNESINVAVGGLFSGLMILNLQLNDLNSEYAIPNLLKTMTNWFILADPDFMIRRTNVAFLENMGKNREYWENQPVQILFETKQWEECKRKLIYLKKNQTIECEFEIENEGKIHYILFAITPVFKSFKILPLRNKNIKAYAFVGTNLSEFKASENKIKAYAKELEASVHALESFAFIASHDLKEPIRSIGSFATLLRRRLAKTITPDVSDYIGFIEQGVKNMQQLVNSIMAISRIGQEGLVFESIDLNSLLSKKYLRLGMLFKGNKARLIVDELPDITADPQLVEQLFQNLLENSIKYNTSDIPTIHIYSKMCPDTKAPLIKIEDNGIGVEKEYREQVFQMFKRLHSKQAYEGAGIGLAICKRIMELHQGKIWIEDTQSGQGIVFVLSFPK